jgi:tetratricopeptide (TPR) repeat protein
MKYLNTFYLYSKLLWYKLIAWFYDVSSYSSFITQAVIYFELGKFKKTLSLLNKIEEKKVSNDQFSYVSYYKGFSFFNLGDFRNAVTFLDDYLKHSPEDSETIPIAAWCHEILKEYDLAFRGYRQLLQFNPDLTGIYFSCAMIMFRTGQKEEAVKWINLGKEKIPPNDLVSIKVIDAQYNWFGGQKKEAIKLLEDALNDFEYSSDAIFFKNDLFLILADWYGKSGDVNARLRILENLYAEIKTDSWLNNELAFEYAEQGIKLNTALSISEESLNFHPLNFEFLDTKAWILYKLNRFDEALDTVDQCLKLNPNCEDAQKHRDLILEILK